MNDELREALRSLEAEIGATRKLLADRATTREIYLADHAIALYLHAATETAECVACLGRARRCGTVPMHVRHLWETAIDLAYFFARDPADGELLAARSLVWNLFEIERHYSVQRGTVPPADELETPEELVDRIRYMLRGMGLSEDSRALDDLYQEFQRAKRLHNHWSGRSVAERIELVSKSTTNPPGWSDWTDRLFRITSSASHASPVWGHLYGPPERFGEPGQPVALPEYKTSDEDAVPQITMTGGCLAYIRRLVEWAGWA